MGKDCRQTGERPLQESVPDTRAAWPGRRGRTGRLLDPCLRDVRVVRMWVIGRNVPGDPGLGCQKDAVPVWRAVF